MTVGGSTIGKVNTASSASASALRHRDSTQASETPNTAASSVAQPATFKDSHKGVSQAPATVQGRPNP